MEHIISTQFTDFLNACISSDEFKKINFYVRAIKRPPHNGVFDNNHQCMFIKYNLPRTHHYLTPGTEIPFPINHLRETVETLIQEHNIGTEDILRFCFRVDDQIPSDRIFAKLPASTKFFIALGSNVLSLINPNGTQAEYSSKIHKAVSGEIEFLQHFNCNQSRLIDILVCFLIELSFAELNSIQDILELESLLPEHDKYGLSNVTCAQFGRHGFRYNGKYYLYNIFFDTSIASPTAKAPRTIELFKRLDPSLNSIYMRCDESLLDPAGKIAMAEELGLERWRGRPLNIEHLDREIRTNKEVIVHYDPENMHKLLVVIKPEHTSNNEPYYHISVEELWSPISLYNSEENVLTNSIHGCYFPMQKRFDHVDFSVNQYNRDKYAKKHADLPASTSVSIEQYSDLHYKVWCIKGSQIDIHLWEELVFWTLDTPFRKLFLEIIERDLYNE